MNLQFMSANEASDTINTMNSELSDFDIKAALINALDRIAHLEKQSAQSVRDAALEEAASVYMVGNVAAREIRKLKSSPQAPKTEGDAP